MYRVVLSRRAEKALLVLPSPYAERVRTILEGFRDNPRGRGAVKLDNMPVAQYRFRIGDCRILFDIEERTATVEILDIRRRSERTYK